MRLAWLEMRRAGGRFSAIGAAVVLIVFLVVVLNALADGLYYGATGAIRTGGADLYVFSSDGRKQLPRSSLPASASTAVAKVPNVASVGELGVLQGTARDRDRTLDVALIGYSPGQPGGPAQAVTGRLPKPHENDVAAVDTSLRDKQVRLGDAITFAGSSREITVIGFVSDSRYQLQPTVWATIDTWRSVRNEARPEFQGRQTDVQAIAVKLIPGADNATAVRQIEAALGGGVEVVDRETAILALPGVKAQRSTLNQVIYTTFFVAALVIALFFALVTLEKRTQLATLKALGASGRYLATGIVLQSLVITVVGLVVGTLLARLVGSVLPSSVPVTFRAGTAGTTAAATIFAGVLGAAASFRRLSRIDPATALGGT